SIYQAPVHYAVAADHAHNSAAATHSPIQTYGASGLSISCQPDEPGAARIWPTRSAALPAHGLYGRNLLFVRRCAGVCAGRQSSSESLIHRDLPMDARRTEPGVVGPDARRSEAQSVRHTRQLRSTPRYAGV